MGAASIPVQVVEEERRGGSEGRDVDKMDIGGGGGGGGGGGASSETAHASMLRTLNPTNPLRIVINGDSQVPLTPSTSTPAAFTYSSARAMPMNISIPQQQQQQHPHHHHNNQGQQPSFTSLNSRRYSNKLSLIVFLFHLFAVVALVGFLLFKAVEGFIKPGPNQLREKHVLKHYLPQVEASSLLSIVLAFSWQKSVRLWPHFMVHFILWSSSAMSLSAGILLICFQRPTTDACGVPLIAFSIASALYACWASQRASLSTNVLIKSLQPLSKFSGLNHPSYYMLLAGFLWMSLWILAVIGSLNFYFTPAVIIALVLSLAWITEVMRNVANLTVSRVIALYYLRGMQSSTKFCFQRALTRNLGSAALGSLFVPAIEALRIIARGLNLLEGEDEFMFSCAHCCLRAMESIFRHGNGWAYVQIAAYGKNFVKASQDTWALFEKQEMEAIVDSDITSAVCFLSGVCSGSICVILAASWTHKVHPGFTATTSLIAFFVGYLMTRIAMALPHACVSCYYVCYAENPQNRLFDNTIPDRLSLMRSGRDVVVPTPRVPRRFIG